MKKISILIPVYNTSKYLEKCLNSIINQSLKNIEIICVNDGSTDNSLEILKKYKELDSRITIINKKNGGSSSARNEALKKATGKYCLNIDSDDWIEQGYLEEMYEKAEREELDMVISDIIFDYGYKKEIKKDLNVEDSKNLSGEDYLDIFFKNNFHGYTWNKLIRRECFDNYDIRYNEKIFLYEDVEVVVKLAFHMKKIGKLNKAFYHYIQGENNGSKRAKFKNYLDIEECFIELERYFDKNFQQLIYTRKNIALLENLLEYNYIKDEDYYSKRNELLKEIKLGKDKLIDEVSKRKVIKTYLLFNNKYIFELLKKLILIKKYFKKGAKIEKRSNSKFSFNNFSKFYRICSK